MKEDICKVCGSDLKWVGSIMDGHVECPNCDAAGVNIDFGSGDESCVTYSYSVDDGVVYQSGSTFTISNNPVVVSTDPVQTAEDKCNLEDYTEYYDGTIEIGGRRSGKTTAMLERAANSHGRVYVVCHNRAMVKYCANILVEKFHCCWKNMQRHELISPDGCIITVMDALEARGLNRQLKNRYNIYFDHVVSYWQWEGVMYASH